MRATLSILSLSQYDEHLFDDLVIPEELDRETLINNIILECAELEILYPDADFMRLAIGYWSKVQLDTWEKLYRDFSMEYNPIENYDRTEEWTDDGTNKRTVHSTTKQNSGYNDVSKETQSSRAYNSDSLVSNDVVDKNISGTSNDGVTADGVDDTTMGNVRKGYVHGNIGVRSAQEMLEQSIQLEPKTNMYTYITNSFKTRFCLLVY